MQWCLTTPINRVFLVLYIAFKSTKGIALYFVTLVSFNTRIHEMN